MNSLTDLQRPLPVGEREANPVAEPDRWATMRRHWKTRPALLTLDSAQLRDIGISREEAHAEAHKPFWKD